jgi:hypothetical protein
VVRADASAPVGNDDNARARPAPPEEDGPGGCAGEVHGGPAPALKGEARLVFGSAPPAKLAAVLKDDAFTYIDVCSPGERRDALEAGTPNVRREFFVIRHQAAD